MYDEVGECLIFANESPELLRNAFNFFASMFEMESKFNTNYMDNYWNKVRDFVLNFLLNYDEEFEESQGGLSLSQAAFNLLKEINKRYFD